MSKARMFVTTALLGLSAVTANAQTKVIPGEMQTVTVTVETIEQKSREVSVRKPDGTVVNFYVPPSMKRFDTLKVGDKITAKYYDNVVLQLKQPGTPDVNTASSALVPVEGAPSGTMSYQRAITATITAIDQKAPSITFSGPNGWKYSSLVKDRAALAKVKVGDKVDITWTMAVLMAVE